MAKYIVDLQEIYEDKSDIDEYLITTDTRAITNTFTRQPTVKSDTRVALNPSEKLDVSMQKIDRYLQQLKDVAFYNPLTNINTTISSEANQVFTAKVVKTFYDNYTETDARTKAMANAYGWDFTSGALQQKISDAILKTNSAGTGLEWKKLSETTVNKANKLSVYDQNSNDVSNFTANVKDDRNAPVYIYGTTQTEPYKARPYLATNTSVKSAVSSTKASNLKMFTAAGTELSPEGLITAKEISSGNKYVEFMNNVSKVLVINSAREASSVNSGGILGGGLITFTWKGETGTPEYVFGGPSKDKVHVYQPKNFSVKHATTSDSTDYATNSGHADSADEATHATSADTADSADEATHATSADSANKATKADKADRATNADNADEAAHAAEANHATSADEATHATSADSANNANHAASADNATHAASADSATTAGSATTATTAGSANTAGTANYAASADNATHAASADNATHATSADSATTATKATSATKAENADNAAKADYASAAPWTGVTGKPIMMQVKYFNASYKPYGLINGAIYTQDLGLYDICGSIKRGSRICYTVIMTANINHDWDFSVYQKLASGSSTVYESEHVDHHTDVNNTGQIVNVYSGYYTAGNSTDITYSLCCTDVTSSFGSLGHLDAGILMLYYQA